MSYWRNRELNHIKQSIENDERIARRIRRNQQRAMNDIETQIEAFYGRYADVEGISMSEARKRVSKLDVKKYGDKAKQYVKERNFSKVANEQMRIYNVTMNINRLELLKANIHLELLAMTSEEQRVLFEEMTKSARAEYERQAGILGETLNFNEKNIASIVNSSFLTAEWSDRLWDNQDALRSELDRLLNRSIIQGRNPREMARELRKTFDTSIFNSERLLITETARVQQDVFQDSMKQAEIGQYEYIAELSACDVCAALDGKIFDVDDAESGRNAYPMHPFCKCSQAAYVDREAFERDLDARGLTDGADDPREEAKKFAEEIDLDNMDDNNVRILNETLDELFAEYPRPKFRKLTTKTSQGSAGTFKGSINPSLNVKEGQMAIGRHFNNDKNIQNMAESTKSGEFVGWKDSVLNGKELLKKTVTHEFAHSMFDSRHGNRYMLKEMKKVKSAYTRELNKQLKEHRVPPNYAIVGKTLSKEEFSKFKDTFISNYANQDMDEFVAEAFTDFHTSEKYSRYSEDVVKIIKKYMLKPYDL